MVGPDVDGPRRDDPPADDPAPSPAPEWLIVELPEGETLIHVARRHLGDGRRWQEILDWNGWTEPDSRRLPTGQPVKIKASEARPQQGR